MSISEAYRKRLPLLTRTIFEDVMEAIEPKTDLVEIPSEYVQENLNQKIWNGEALKPEIRQKMLEIITAYKEHLNLTAEPKSIRLVGSMANYNWTEVSDIDIHLFYNIKEISKNTALAKEFLESKGAEWKNKHKITLKGYSVEMYAQDVKDLFFSGGVYDLIEDNWITKPKRDKVIIDKSILRAKIAHLIEEIKKIDTLSQKDISSVYNKAKALKNKIKKMRQAGLEKTGEYSIENLTFKYLRNKGFLEKLSDAVLKAFDAQLSLNEKSKIQESISDVSNRIGIDQRFLKEKIFKNKRNPNLILTVTTTSDGRIVEIENEMNINFPYKIGQILNMGHETWACNNNYTVNDKNTCPEEKIFGIRKKDIPQGHELRILYPGKFTNENEKKAMKKEQLIINAAKKAKIDISKYNIKQLITGYDVELEHGTKNKITNITNDDPVMTLKIVLAHLNETPNYYTKLKKYVETDSKKSLDESVTTNQLKKNINESEYSQIKHKLILKKSVDNINENQIKLIKEFIVACCKELQINEPCIVYLTGKRGGPITTTASYNPENDHIWIYTKNRNMLADPLRSLAHEIRHFKQKLDGVLDDLSGEDGSEHENEANSFSGLMIRKFGRAHRDIYQ